MRQAEIAREVAVFAVLFSVLVLAGLGHYALWDDEANTALFAQSVWQHGLPQAEISEKVIAFRNGVQLTNGVNQFMPPPSYYVASPPEYYFCKCSLLFWPDDVPNPQKG